VAELLTGSVYWILYRGVQGTISVKTQMFCPKVISVIIKSTGSKSMMVDPFVALQLLSLQVKATPTSLDCIQTYMEPCPLIGWLKMQLPVSLQRLCPLANQILYYPFQILDVLNNQTLITW